MSISENALDVDTFQYDTRSSLLNAIRCSKDAYYLWVDGMGVEWIDMLIEKVVQRKEELKNPVVEIGMAVMPTTTFANMKKADSETVSYKFDRFDSLSHIKDKSDCNYFSIIDKQFEMIGSIADLIVQLSNDHPQKLIVVTADHGMSRMAAKAFHEKQGITPPKGAEIKNLGRYCILPHGVSPYDFSHAYKEDNCLAFRDHSHFVCSGYAPGGRRRGRPSTCTFRLFRSRKPTGGSAGTGGRPAPAGSPGFQVLHAVHPARPACGRASFRCSSGRGGPAATSHLSGLVRSGRILSRSLSPGA